MKTKIIFHTVVFLIVFLNCAFAGGNPEGGDLGFGKGAAASASGREAFSHQRIVGIPLSHMIDNVPLIVQGRNECGPTTLSMIMRYHGIEEVASHVLKSSLKWHSENGVSYQNMIRFPYQKYGLELAFAGEGNYRQVLEELSRNNPVLVRQWANREEKKLNLTGHWRIAVGYDQKTGKIYLNDPMFAKSTCLDKREFLSLWDMSRHPNPTKNYMFLLRKASGQRKNQIPSTL
jgi:ABC-type bacteriocin/lantibiotic exporter with double-glycine peptidase domain